MSHVPIVKSQILQVMYMCSTSKGGKCRKDTLILID